jgi:GTPase SAR1 family protein
MVICGSSNSGKTSFLLGKAQIDPEFNHLGVSFKPIECLVNDDDSYKFIVWDLKVKERFRFLYPVFCRGTSAAFICFDTSNRSSFEEISYWVNIFKNLDRFCEEKIPIILIGTKTDLSNQVISDKEINELIVKNNLDGIFYTSIYDSDRKEKKEEVFKHLIERVEPFYHIYDCSIFIPKEDEYFKGFAKIFSICPVCKRNNHFESLKNFYYSRDPAMLDLKERLLDLIDEASDFDKIYYNKISFGIPCCSCFEKYFSEKS